MRAFLHIAIRNIFRNKKRSLITLASVTFGLCALIFLRGFMFGVQHQMVENITNDITGDIQIIPREQENIYNTNGFIEDPALIRTVLGQDKRIAAFAEEIVSTGLVSSATNSVAAFLVGVDPKREEAIGVNFHLMKGQMLQMEDTYGVLIGEKMRQSLEIEMGDKLVVTAQDFYGALAGEAFRVVGTFETGNDQLDNGNVIMLLGSAERLLSFENRRSKFTIKTVDDEALEPIVQELRQQLKPADLKVATWEELVPMFAQIIRFQNGMIFVIMSIVLIVVCAGILNTLMMSIVERTRELGLMMALGTKPVQIILLIGLESFLLTAFGTLIGVALGVALVTYFGHAGIDLSRFVSSAFGNLLIGTEVHPRVDWRYSSIFCGIILVGNFLISLYPAWRASRLVPVEAMRQVG